MAWKSLRFGALWIALVLAGCGGESLEQAVIRAGGDPDAGRVKVAQFGCPACHSIPGFAAGEGQIGPSLAGLAERPTLAGGVPNTPENLMLWIRRPSDVVPGTTMPVLGLTEQDSRDVAAFLYSLP